LNSVFWESVCDIRGVSDKEILASFGPVNLDEIIYECIYNVVGILTEKWAKVEKRNSF
jgi:hypothetical protein